MEKRILKCAKCGVTSKEDSSLQFHRFPQPSCMKAKVWAKYCYPEGDWTSNEFLNTLYKQHMMLCSKHFDESSYTSSARIRLNKFALPIGTQDILTQLRNNQYNPPSQPHDTDPQSDGNVPISLPIQNQHDQETLSPPSQNEDLLDTTRIELTTGTLGNLEAQSPEDIDYEEPQHEISQCFDQVLKDQLSENNRKSEVDNCDLYGQLLARKLRRYPEIMREEIMEKIDGILLDNPYPMERPSSACSNYSASSLYVCAIKLPSGAYVTAKI